MSRVKRSPPEFRSRRASERHRAGARMQVPVLYPFFLVATGVARRGQGDPANHRQFSRHPGTKQRPKHLDGVRRAFDDVRMPRPKTKVDNPLAMAKPSRRHFPFCSAGRGVERGTALGDVAGAFLYPAFLVATRRRDGASQRVANSQRLEANSKRPSTSLGLRRGDNRYGRPPDRPRQPAGNGEAALQNRCIRGLKLSRRCARGESFDANVGGSRAKSWRCGRGQFIPFLSPQEIWGPPGETRPITANRRHPGEPNSKGSKYPGAAKPACAGATNRLPEAAPKTKVHDNQQKPAIVASVEAGRGAEAFREFALPKRRMIGQGRESRPITADRKQSPRRTGKENKGTEPRPAGGDESGSNRRAPTGGASSNRTSPALQRLEAPRSQVSHTLTPTISAPPIHLPARRALRQTATTPARCRITGSRLATIATFLRRHTCSAAMKRVCESAVPPGPAPAVRPTRGRRWQRPAHPGNRHSAATMFWARPSATASTAPAWRRLTMVIGGEGGARQQAHSRPCTAVSPKDQCGTSSTRPRLTAARRQVWLRRSRSPATSAKSTENSGKLA